MRGLVEEGSTRGAWIRCGPEVYSICIRDVLEEKKHDRTARSKGGMRMNVIKRDGREEKYSQAKVLHAIQGAVNEVKQISPEAAAGADEIAGRIASRLTNRFNCWGRQIDVEEIQDCIEQELMKEGLFDVARAFIKYRYMHTVIRNRTDLDSRILAICDGVNEEVIQENSNKNPLMQSTQRDYIAGEASRNITERILLPDDIAKAHKEGIIHFHDTDYYVQRMFNCCLVNLEDMLQNGTMVNNVLIEKPHRFSTACTIASQIVASVSSGQYGGQTISLTHLAPFVNESRKTFRRHVEQELKDAGVEADEATIARLTEDRTRDDIRVGVQTLQYQINTLLTTNGQAPFVSVAMYLGEAKDERTKTDLAMVIEEVLKQRLQGVKNESGAWVTPAFPKLLYILEEDNIHEDSRFWYLTELAAKCTAKRMVPDYISEKVMKQNKIDANGNGQCYPCIKSCA